MTNLDVLKTMHHDEREYKTSIYLYYIDTRHLKADTWLKFYSTDNLMIEKLLVVYSFAYNCLQTETGIFGMPTFCAHFR